MPSFEIEKIRTLTGHNGPVYAITQIPGSDTFYSSGNDGMIVEWKLDGTDAGRMLARVSNSVYCLIFVSETGHLIAGHNYDGIHIFDLKEKKETGSLRMTDAAIFDIKKSGLHLFIATGKGEIKIVDLRSMKVIHTIKLSSANVRSLEIVGDSLVAGYSDNCIRIIGMQDLQVRKTWVAHNNSVFILKKNPSGEYLLSGGRDAHLKVWDVKNNYTLNQSIVAHMFTINSIDFNTKGSHFLTGSMDKTLKLWDAGGFKLLKVIDKERFGGHLSSVNKLVWSNYKNMVISCSDDRTISLWEIKI
jgi:WD40 repeat protein